MKEAQAAATLAGAVANTGRVSGELAAAWSGYRAALAVWEGLLAGGRGVHAVMGEAAVAARVVIEGQRDTPFERNPHGVARWWKSVGSWVGEHGGVLRGLSDVLVTVGSVVALLPGLGTVVGAVLVGAGLGVGLVLALTGNMSWGEFVMTAVMSVPGVGKVAQLGKLAKLSRVDGVLGKVGKVCANDPVDVVSGAVVDSEVDLRIEGVFPLVFTRHVVTSVPACGSFGPSWVSLLDCRIEVGGAGVVFLSPEGDGVDFGVCVDDREVPARDVSGWWLSFVDGAYRVRDVASGVSYEFSVVGDRSVVRATTVAVDSASGTTTGSEGVGVGVGESSLAGRMDMAVAIGCSAVVHRSGHRYEIDYDAASGVAHRVRTSGGAVVWVGRDEVSGRVVGLSVSDERGGDRVDVVSYEYSVAGELVGVRDSSGRLFSYGYDVAGRMSWWTDRNGTTYRYRYDQWGRCVSQAGSGGVFTNASVYLADTGPGAVAGGRLSVMIQTVRPLSDAADIATGGNGVAEGVGIGSGAVDVAVGVPDVGVVIDELIDRVEGLGLVSVLRSGGVEGAGVVLPGREGASGEGVDCFAGVDEWLWRDEVLGEVRCEVYRSDPDGLVWQVIDAGGGVRTLGYERGRVVREVDALGGVWVCERDVDGLVVGERYPDGTGIEVEYGSWGVPARVVDSAGRVTQVGVDAAGNVVSVVSPDGGVMQWEYEYRVSGSVVSRVVDVWGVSTVVECDGAGRPVRVVDAVGAVREWRYDVCGRVVAQVDEQGRETLARWSPEGLLVECVYPDGSVWRADYDGEGNVVASVDEAGGLSRRGWGVMDVVTETVDAGGGRLQVRYDSQLAVREVVNPDGLVWRFEYDRAGRVVGETDYNGARTVYERDVAGRVVSRVDALGQCTRHRFDRLGRLVVIDDDVDGRSELRWNAAGELVEAVNADARVVYERDRDSGVVVAETVNGITTSWQVDMAGRRAVRTVDTADVVPGAGGRWVSVFDRDSRGLLAAVTTTTSTATAAATRAESAAMSVVAVGGRHMGVDGLRFSYDVGGREVSRGVGARARITQRRDVRDRLIEQIVTSYQPDTARPVHASPHSGAGAGAGGGLYASPGGRVVAGRWWEFRADSVVTAIADVVAGRMALDVDAVGRVMALTAHDSGPHNPGTRNPGVAHPGIHNSGVGGVLVEGFGYTPGGVLASVAGSGVASGVAASPVAGVARVAGQGRVEWSGTLVTRVGRDRFVYDGAGRLVERVRSRLSRKPVVTRFSYTGRGQVREVRTGGGSVWRYGYDVFGRRVWKTHVGGDGRVVDEVVCGWDGDDLVVQSNRACTARGGVDAGGVSTWVWTYHPDTGAPLEQHERHYTPTGTGHGHGGGVSGERLGDREVTGGGRHRADMSATHVSRTHATPRLSGSDVVASAASLAGGEVGGVDGWSQGRVDDEFFAIVSDLADAPTELIDVATGEIAGRAQRSVWGHTRWVGRASTPLRFAGQHYDPESDLHYNRYRYYNPVTTSYTTADPLGVHPNPANATAYVINPYTWTDRLGLKAACEVIKKWGPHEYGPSPKNLAETFRGGSYTEKVTQRPIMLYRAYTEGKNPLGNFWSRSVPTGPIQARIDSALNPEWGNRATAVSKIEVPIGTRLFEGHVAPQEIYGGGELLGGGNQIVFTPKFRVPTEWLR
ncbi:MAG: RHS repeat-associated core domain-containing protein [Gordonia sp. (in: high G+C Gram-positive bacteria)]